MNLCLTAVQASSLPSLAKPDESDLVRSRVFEGLGPSWASFQINMCSWAVWTKTYRNKQQWPDFR